MLIKMLILNSVVFKGLSAVLGARSQEHLPRVGCQGTVGQSRSPQGRSQGSGRERVVSLIQPS